MRLLHSIFLLFISVSIVSCSFIKGATEQYRYQRAQKENPGQYNMKHMLESDTFFVNGMVHDPDRRYTNKKLAVAAYSSKFRRHELVDITYFASAETHYSLNLPAGKYDLLVLMDKDGNRVYDQSEVIAYRKLDLNKNEERTVLTGLDLNITKIKPVRWDLSIQIPVYPEIKESLFYPRGTLRSLDDPIFGRDISSLGMYQPATFMEKAPTMFYALEEYVPYKIPVIFVHGMGGTSREFATIVAQLDRDKYMPWFFYYPSGSDLNKLAENFYRIFLSGELFPKIDTPFIIVAHSMGGLIMREVMNLYKASDRENHVAQLITIASPLGGHPAAASSLSSPMVLPAWRDLDPGSRFVKDLYRKPLPKSVNHQLLYAFGNNKAMKLGENSDGVVPLSSQLNQHAQQQASRTFGVNNTHTGILKDPIAINYIIHSIETVKSYFPESHIELMKTGGYDLELGDRYTNKEKFLLRTLGKYLRALARGELVAVTPYQKHFVKVMQGELSPKYFAETTWLKFNSEHAGVIRP